MDMRRWKEVLTRRSSIWTLGLCMTGILVLGGIVAVDQTRRTNEKQAVETEIGDLAMLDDQGKEDRENEGNTQENSDLTADGTVSGNEAEGNQDASAADDPAAAAEVNGTGVADEAAVDGADLGDDVSEGASDADGADSGAGNETVSDSDTSGNEAASGSEVSASADGAASMDGSAADGEAAQASSTGVISEQLLLMEGIDFSSENYLMWPAAGTILIDYSMDGSVYFPTLNQYKYNPALVIGSEAGNQVLAAAKGIVESIYVDEETGTTLVMNIGNGYKLTYGQLKELAVEEGDIVEAGTLVGYVSEPTKYYSREGSNLYFAMTKEDQPVDPVQFLE